jgi:hypothetical protein
MPTVRSRVLFAELAEGREPAQRTNAMRASSAPPAPLRISKPSRAPLAPSAPLVVVFAAAWIGLQATLVLTASKRADAIFGFRMFAESSTIRAHLTREVDLAGSSGASVVQVRDGEWIARDKDGTPHRVRWRDRVIEGNLATFDRVMHASYSADAQVERWKAALDDVAAHLEGDAETRRLRLELVVRKNGREPVTYDFESAPR